MKNCSYSLFLIFYLIFVGTAFGQVNYYDLDQLKTSKHLAIYSKILEDKNHQYKSDQIIADENLLKDFVPVENTIPYLDFTSSTFWQILYLENKESEDKKYYLELARPLTNQVELFIYDENNLEVQHFLSGDEYEFKDRPYQHRSFIFPIVLKGNQKSKLLVRAKSDGEILKLPLKLWLIDEFTQFASKENFLLGLYYGLFILVIFLFSFFGFALRENIYLYFVLYVVSMALFQFSLDGFAYQFFWPHSPWFGNHAILIFAAISMIFMQLYVRHFLHFTKEKSKYLKVYYFFMLLVVFSLLGSLTNNIIYSIIFPVLNGLSFLIICYILIGIILNSKTNNKSEAPLVVAFVILVIGSVTFILSNVDIIHSEFLASNALKLGTAAEVTFLSLAMANRYRKTQDEKIEAQLEAFKNLEELNALKDQQTEKLEIQVKERTQEIQEKSEKIAEKNQEILNSINYAKRLQDAILPPQNEINSYFKDSMVLFMPKDIVSGDFYWMIENQNQLFFAVADCTGHGVPGAMVSVLGNNSLGQCVNEFGLTDSGKILDKLTDLVEKTLSNKNTRVSDGMDINICIWDKQKGLQYSGANNPLYLIRNGELIEYKADKQPIGHYSNRKPFTRHNIEIEKGDCIFLFTDGYADQFGGPRNKKLKYSVFKEYLVELSNSPFDELEKELKKRFNDWKGDYDQIDDVCIMGIKF